MMREDEDASAAEAAASVGEAAARSAAGHAERPVGPGSVAAPPVAATVLRLTDDRLLAFAEYGRAEGVPVVAFHGTPGSRLQLTALDGPAREVGVRLIVPDRPGYGASDHHPGRTLGDWPADVQAIAAHLGLDRYAVLGVSGGAPHALACAIVSAQRITRLGIVSGVAPPDCWAPSPRSGRLEQAVGLLMRTGGTVLQLLVGTVLTLIRRATGPALRAYQVLLPPADRRIIADPAIRRGLQDEIERQPRTTAATIVQDLRLFSRPWGFDVGATRVPTDIWHGGADRAIPIEHARALAARIPASSLHEHPDAGHFLLLEQAKHILEELARPAEGG
jgi:pimeloyl-ACP methyl ester carboxylesterase